jgi:hypothetical protein
MRLGQEEYESFTTKRQRGVQEFSDYYARNGYWKPPLFNVPSKTWVHLPSGTTFMRVNRVDTLEHFGVGRMSEQMFYMKLPRDMKGETSYDEIISGMITVTNQADPSQRQTFTVIEFFIDGPLRKTGYIKTTRSGIV